MLLQPQRLAGPFNEQEAGLLGSHFSQPCLKLGTGGSNQRKQVGRA